MAAWSNTFTNILAASRAILREATASFWTDAQLLVYANEGIKAIAWRVGGYRTFTTVSTTASTRLVSFTGYKCLAVEYSNKALIKITPLQLGHVPLDGIYPQYWFEFGNYIGIEPIPPEIYTLTVYLASIPTNMTTGASVPSVPYAFCGMLTYYIAARALEQDRQFEASAQLMDMYTNDLSFLSMALLPNIPNGQEDIRFK